MPSNSNWRLEAISKAALNAPKRSFTLKNGMNQVGKSKSFEVAIPSALCSRRHCQIIVENNCVSLQDTSRNGTYINDKHIVGQKSKLGHNDIISFGFNCLKLYNIKDKQAFIYRVIKEADLDTINIYDSDENDDANDDDVVVVLDSDSADGSESEKVSDASEVTDDERIRDIDDDVVISSDDDDYYDSDDSIGSGDFVVTQRVNNRAAPPTIDLHVDDDIEHISTEKTDPKDDQVLHTETNKEQKSDDIASSTSTSSIVTEKVEKEVTLKPNENKEQKSVDDASSTLTSSIATEQVVKEILLNPNGIADGTNASKDDANGSKDDANASKNDANASNDDANASKVDTNASKVDANASEDDANALKVDANVSKDDANALNDDANASKDDANASENITNTTNVDMDTFEEVMDTNESATKSIRSGKHVRRGFRVISAQPLRKRRRTITEREYEDSKKLREQKRLERAEKLAQIAIDEKEKQANVAAEAAATAPSPTTPNGNDIESKRSVAIPKVKISQVSRAEMLATDMLADSTK